MQTKSTICATLGISRRTFYRYEGELRLPTLRVGILSYAHIPMSRVLRTRSSIEQYHLLVARRLALLTRTRFHLIPVDPCAALLKVEKGEIDLALASLSWTRARAEKYCLSDSYSNILRPSGRLYSLMEREEVNSKPRLAVIQASVHEEFAERELSADFLIFPQRNFAALARVLASRQADFILVHEENIENAPELQALGPLTARSKTYLYPSYSTIIFHPRVADYRPHANAAISIMRGLPEGQNL